jgi:hypothetical protein
VEGYPSLQNRLWDFDDARKKLAQSPTLGQRIPIPKTEKRDEIKNQFGSKLFRKLCVRLINAFGCLWKGKK